MAESPTEEPPRWSSREITMGDLRIGYFDSAPEGGSLTLLCIHGYGGNAMDYSSLPRHLPADIRLVAFDFPGSGRSDPPADHSYTMDLYLKVLGHMIKSFPVDGLVAHSLGGKVALNWIHDNPDRFDRLVLIAPYGMEGEEGEAFLKMARRPALVRLGFTLSNRWAMRINARRTIFYDGQKIDRAVARAGEASQLSRHGRRAMAEVTLSMVASDPIDHVLPDIRVPVLLIWGGEDRLLPPAWGSVYRDLLSDARLIILPQCGHLVMVEKDAETASEIVAFMTEGR